jgi:hypothetical protein
MKRSRKNFAIDSLAFICFVFLVSTGVIMYYILPPGSGRGRTIWGLDRHEWGDIHFYFSVGFLAILAIHLFLHWNWIVSLVKGKKRETSGRRALLGLVGALAVLAIALTPILTPVESSGDAKNEMKEGMHNEETGIKINGSMTLAEVQESSGIQVSYILQKLQLPEDIPPDTKLGELKNKFGFTMDEVRKIVEEYDQNP